MYVDPAPSVDSFKSGPTYADSYDADEITSCAQQATYQCINSVCSKSSIEDPIYGDALNSDDCAVKSNASDDTVIKHEHSIITLKQITWSNDYIKPQLEHCIHTGFFWNEYILIKSRGNGHCIINSIKSCLLHCMNIDMTVESLLDALMSECINNWVFYMEYYSDGKNRFFQEMTQYVYGNLYDSNFCDILPLIMCNALNTCILVIDKQNGLW